MGHRPAPPVGGGAVCLAMLLALGLVLWGLIQRFRGSAPEAGDTPEARRDDQAEGLLAIGSGLLLALAVLAFWWLNRA